MNWYEIENIDTIDSPSLVIYLDSVQANIDKAVAITGATTRLRPHVKTHKTPEIVDLHLEKGIFDFKSATIAEDVSIEANVVIGDGVSIGKGTSIVPSTKKVAGMGARLDVPITHMDWSYVGSHYDAIEVGVPDGPKPDEMVVILAMGVGGRVHARLAGGFTLADRGKPGVPA